MPEQLSHKSSVAPTTSQGAGLHECSNPPPATARRPQQARGQRRVDAILDCAAELVAEEGIAGVKLHRIAQRTCTATGSMYHFFPDRDALLRALLERHSCQLRAHMEQLHRAVGTDWSQLSTAELVDRLVDPFLNYIDQHPDFLRLTRLVRINDRPTDRDAELDQSVVRLHETLVALRHPKATSVERKIIGLSITAMAEGFFALMARTDADEDIRLLRLELRRALVAYLDSYVESTPASEG